MSLIKIPRLAPAVLSLLLAIPLAHAEKPAAELIYEKVEWVDMIPPDDLEALMNPPEYLSEIEDGSMEDRIANQVTNAMLAATDDPYQQALNSTKVVEAFDGKAVELPGFIVPLSLSGDYNVTSFFLVPYFGACIHTPPPPPNQMVYVEYAKGVDQRELYKPYRLTGILRASVTENKTGVSAYSLEPHTVEEY